MKMKVIMAVAREQRKKVWCCSMGGLEFVERGAIWA